MDHTKYEREAAAKWIKQMAAQFARAAAEMNCYAQDFEDVCAKGQVKEAAKYVGWAVNGAVNVLPNLRLDMAAMLAADLVAAAEAAKAGA